MSKITLKKKPKILMVEDDDFMSNILTRELTRAGLTHYSIVARGEEALKEFKKYKPDIIVLDILLPGKSGLEALKDIRRTRGGKTIPVFILTNYGNPEYRKIANELGVKDYLIKSNTLVSDLIQKIKEIEKIK